MFLFRADAYEGTLSSSAEGRMEWVTLDEMRAGGLAPNMEEYIRVLTDDNAIEAIGNGGRGGEGILDVIRLREAQRKE